MKKGLFLVLGLSVLLTTAHATQADGCNRYYQSAVKFIVDTPTVHSFTVSAGGRKVLFSTGNLQYCPSRDTWRFALRQFDRVGNGKSVYAPEGLKTAGTNVNDNVTTVFYDSIDYSTPDLSTPSKFKEIKGVPCNNLLVSKKYGGWIDVFAWGTSGHGRRVGDSLAMFFNPYDLSDAKINNANNVYAFGPSFDAGHGSGATSNDIDSRSGMNQWFDWGYRNAIREYHNCVYDANQALVVQMPDSTMYRRGVWRTLTADEWTYLLTERMVEGKQNAFTYVRLKYGNNPTDTVSGVLIYPDDFSFSEAGVATLPFGANNAVSNIDATVWGLLEEAGVVFLPSVRQRTLSNGVPSINADANGLGCAYWSASAYDAENAYNVWFNIRERGLATKNYNPRYIAYPVRLVQDMMVRWYYATITKECEYEWDLEGKKITVKHNKAGVKFYNDTLRTADGEDSLYCILALTKELPVHEIKDTTYSISNYTFILDDYKKSWNLEEAGHAVNTTKIYNLGIILSDGDCDTALLRLKLTRKVAEFSVAADKKVTFSSGNVQYRGSTKTWRFAPTQYDRRLADNENIAENYDGWIDLFGWGTGNNPTQSTKNQSDYPRSTASFVDWGTNKINNYPKDTWHTLKRTEWDYLINTRQVNGGAGYSYVRIQKSSSEQDTVSGAIIYPDNFRWAKAGITAIPVGANGLQKINATQWTALEKVGCVFLPACSKRIGTSAELQYGRVGTQVLYWTASYSNFSQCMYFDISGSVSSTYTLSNYNGCTVRLVRDL